MLDFLGIGAQKAGTTWLYEALAAHPAIGFPAGKEIHFWDQGRSRGTAWYRALFEGAPPGVKCGEITPAYAILPLEAIREIRTLNAALRVVYTLRNPIERAWSQAVMWVAREGRSVQATPDEWFVTHFRSSHSRMRGDYETCLRNWRSVFGEQVLVLRYETLCQDPRGYLYACCRHVGVDPARYAPGQPTVLGQKVFGGSPDPLRASLRPVLEEIYAERIRSLAAYLGTKLDDWLIDSKP
jgi:LPS sulfotransferase NodH